jgi:hypothetical protein
MFRVMIDTVRLLYPGLQTLQLHKQHPNKKALILGELCQRSNVNEFYSIRHLNRRHQTLKCLILEPRFHHPSVVFLCPVLFCPVLSCSVLFCPVL